MNVIKDKRTIFHWLFQLIFISFLNDSKSFSITSFTSSFIMISIWIICICHFISRSSSSSSLQKIKLIVVVNLIFHVFDFFRSTMISFIDALILLRYSSPDSVFISPLHLYSIWLLLQNFLPWLVYNNLLPHTKKDS